MYRSMYKGKYSNHTIRIRKDYSENKYVYSTDRFLCSKPGCSVCGKNGKNHKTINNHSSFWQYYST